MDARSFKSAPIDLGRGFSVEFSLSAGRMDCEWSPRVPTGEQGRQLLSRYREARDAFLRAVAQHLGVNVAVAELPAVRS